MCTYIGVSVFSALGTSTHEMLQLLSLCEGEKDVPCDASAAAQLSKLK